MKNGEYARCVPKMKSFIISMDAECWKIIKKIDYLHMDATKQVPIEIEDLNQAHLKELKKNHKALRLLMEGLGDSDKRKVLSSLTTKEKWDALEKIHAGSEDVKQDRILAHTQDYNNLRMKEKETIEEFQSRFMSLVNSLTYLGEEIPRWK